MPAHLIVLLAGAHARDHHLHRALPAQLRGVRGVGGHDGQQPVALGLHGAVPREALDGVEDKVQAAALRHLLARRLCSGEARNEVTADAASEG